jgi:hypothetical protein
VTGVLAAQAASSTPALITGSATLLGVVVGGLLTGFVQEVRERRKDARFSAVGARLLGDDLDRARTSLNGIVESKKLRAEDLPTVSSTWEKYREALAQRLPEEGWQRVRTTVAAVDRAGAELAPYAAGNVAPPPRLLDRLGNVLRQIPEAMATLGPERRAR